VRALKRHRKNDVIGFGRTLDSFFELRRVSGEDLTLDLGASLLQRTLQLISNAQKKLARVWQIKTNICPKKSRVRPFCSYRDLTMFGLLQHYYSVDGRFLVRIASRAAYSSPWGENDP
jgi:hypothetical protein